MKSIKMIAAAATMATAFAGSAPAEEVKLDILYAQPSFAKFHEPMAQAFMKEHPNIKIEFRAPTKDYDEGQLLMQRLAVTNQLPDMYFPGYYVLGELARTLAPRKQILDLQPLIDAEPADWKGKNYADSMLGLGVVDGVKYGMAFNASLPVLYINESLVEKAGLDPKKIPTNWEELLANAKIIHDKDPKVTGLGYTIYDFPDGWLWQAILRQNGSYMVDPKTGKAGFDNKEGLESVKLLRRIVTEGGEPMLEFEQARQQFAAGNTAYFFETPARLVQILGLVGDRFKLNTAPYPINDRVNGGLPTGGSAGIITAKDAAKQKAAWEYLKFATGPLAQKMVVESTGYFPTNKLANGPDYLEAFYKKDPRFTAAAKNADFARNWEGYPGGSTVRIWRAQRDVIGKIMRGDLKEEEGLKQLVDVTNSMLK